MTARSLHALSLASTPKPSCVCSSYIPHLHGKLRYEDNPDVECFTVFLLVRISRARDLMSAPVRRIDEVLALPYSMDDFREQEVPLSDDDSWLYHGEEELNFSLLKRQKEMELYDLKHKKKGKGKGEANQDAGLPSGSNVDQFDPGDIAKTMQALVHKVSSYKGAESPEDRNKEVDLDVDQFIRDLESIMKPQGDEDVSSNIEGGSSLDVDFDDSDKNDKVEPTEDNGDAEDTFHAVLF